MYYKLKQCLLYLNAVLSRKLAEPEHIHFYAVIIRIETHSSNQPIPVFIEEKNISPPPKNQSLYHFAEAL